MLAFEPLRFSAIATALFDADPVPENTGLEMPPFVPRKRRRSSSPPPQVTATAQRSEQRPTIFDTLDAKPKGRTLEDNKAFLDSLSTASSGSGLYSSETEVSNAGPSNRRIVEEAEDEDEEEIDWEDAIKYTAPMTQGGEPSGDLELTIEKSLPLSLVDASGKKKGPSKIERYIRIQTHCMHVQFLLFHNLIRNAWVCDREVQEILVTQLTPGVKREWERWQTTTGISAALEGASGRLGDRRGKEKAERQREWGVEAVKVDVRPSDLKGPDPLVRFLRILVAFWKKRFRICAPGLRKRGYKAPSDLESEIASFQNGQHDIKVHGERVKDIKEFRELARKCIGSRDVGAQLFTALLKVLGLEARLVTSLQTVGFGWSKAEDAPVTKREGSGGICMDSTGRDSEAGESAGNQSMHCGGVDQTTSVKASGRARGNPKMPVMRTRRKHRGGRNMPTEISDNSSEWSNEDDDGSFAKNAKPSATAYAPRSIDKDLAFPTYWSEVFSPAANRYIAVDALVLKTIATTPDALASFEPRGAKVEKAKQVISYIISYASDGTAKDVTVRYLKRHVWPGKTKGFRIPVEKVPVYNSKGKVKRYDEFDWFKNVMSLYERPASKRTWIDDLEEMDLQTANPAREVKAKRETLQGYKNSAEFVLERHLRREEAIIPGRKRVKTFMTGKGEKAKEEKVYRRSDVASCKTSESWHKEGREIKEGEQPIKLVPMRAVTLTRKREVEQAEAEGGGRMMQGLYSRDQSQWIVPQPIADGVIPKNGFGNMDCFVPSMVPEGAVHIRLRGAAKVARKLGIDYAEAVVGFEFGSQRAVPVIEGVVVATENEQILIDAWHGAEEESRRKEDGKREKIALGTWRKFLMGLRIVERVREEYGGNLDEHLIREVNPFINRKKMNDLQGNARGESDTPIRYAAETDQDGELPGGFLRGETNNGEDGRISEFTSFSHDEVNGGGGFLLEDGAVPAEHLISSASKQPPISLVSLHRSTTQGILGTGGDKSESNEEGESASTLEEESQKMVAVIPEARAMPKAVKGDVQKVPQSIDRRIGSRTKGKGLMVEGTSITSETNPVAPQKPESEYERSGHDTDDPASSNYFDSGTTRGRPVPENTGTPCRAPRRAAARRSETTVRSHYFELGSESSQREDRGHAGDGRPVAKRKKTSPRAVRRPRRTN